MNPHFAPSRELIRTEFGLSDAERPWRAEMGVEWMTREEGREAIPPAFTEFIGAQLLRQLANPTIAGAVASE